jgi:HK97 family phage prohead protease
MDKMTKSEKTIVKDVTSKGVVVLQISQFEKYDSDNDRMMKGAFAKTFKDGKQVHLVDHQVGTKTFVGLPIKKDADNLIIESQLNLDKAIARELLSDYEFGLKHGRSLQHSQGFMPVKDRYDVNEKGGFDFFEVNMKEYSTVVFGAESDTPLHAIKDNKTALQFMEQLEKRLNFGFMSDDRGKKIEKHIVRIKELLKTPSIDTSLDIPKQTTSFDLAKAINNLNINI